MTIIPATVAVATLTRMPVAQATVGPMMELGSTRVDQMALRLRVVSPTRPAISTTVLQVLATPITVMEATLTKMLMAPVTTGLMLALGSTRVDPMDPRLLVGSHTVPATAIINSDASEKDKAY